MLNQKEDDKFGEMAVSLGLLTHKDLQNCCNLQKQWSMQGQIISMEQCLLRFEYLTPQQIAIVHQNLLTKSPQKSSLETFGRYQIIIEIGRGSMGVVYKAYDPQLKRIIAIKILQNRGHDDVERFLREAKATAKLKHPNIVEVYDVGRFDGKYFYAMDYIEGLSLEALMKKRKLTIKQCISIIIKISHGIAYAHQQSVIHRDLKPANIMIDKDGHPRVMDFGLAKILDEHDQLSKSGMIIGTVQYMSPEQAEGKIHLVGKHSDVYSLGAILYEILTGRQTFVGNSFAQLVDQVLHKAPTPLTSIKKIIPYELECICLKALEKKTENRYQDAEELVYDLCNFIEGKSIAARKIPIGMKQTFLQARFYKKRILIIFTTLICFFSIILYLISGQKINEQEIINYTKRKMEDLKSYESYVYTDSSQPYIFSYEDKQELQKNLEKYIDLDSLLQKRVNILSSSNTQTLNVVLKIKKEIILQALLLNNSFMNTLQLKICEALCDKEQFLIFRSNVLEAQKKIKDEFDNRIHYIMTIIKTKDKIYLNIYSDELQSMPSYYVIPHLVSYLNSNEKVQKFLAIRSLAKIGNTSLKINNLDSIEYLIQQLKKIDIKRDIAEANEIINGLLFCFEDKRCQEVLAEIIPLIEYQSPLWEEVVLKNDSFLTQVMENNASQKMQKLTTSIYQFLKKFKSTICHSYKINNDLKLEKPAETLKKVDVVYQAPSSKDTLLIICRTFCYQDLFPEFKIESVGLAHAFHFYQEQQEIRHSFYKEIISFHNSFLDINNEKMISINATHISSAKDISKVFVSYEFQDEKNNVLIEERWFYIDTIAQQYYVVGISK